MSETSDSAVFAKPTVGVPWGGAAAAPSRFGPSDRVSFLAEQRRRRREGWRLSVLCALAVLVTGLPLSVVLTPVIYAALLGALRLGNLVIPVPPSVWAGLHRLARLLPALFEALSRGGTHVPASTLVAAGVILVGPGIAAALILWLGLRALFLRAGTGGILLTLGAREPRAGDLEERRLADVVAEMAIAAGVPPPGVRVLDTATVNAAVVGSSPSDAVLVVTRGLLDALTREQTEAVVAHLLASAGDGDLRVAVTVTSAFHAMALAVTVFQAVVGLSGSAWRTIAHTVRWALLQRGDPKAGEAVAAMLEREITNQPEDGIAGVMAASRGGAPTGALARATRAFPPLKLALFPLYLPYVVVLLLAAEVFLLRAILAGPLVMLVWHTRRYLADAMAVQLTRDPDGLAGALERLAQLETGVARSRWAGHLFIVAPRGGQDSGTPDDGEAAEFGSFVGTHPPIRRRLKRLAAMGSALAAAGTAKRRSAWRWVAAPAVALLALVVALPLALAAALIFVLAGGASLVMAGAALALLANLLL